MFLDFSKFLQSVSDDTGLPHLREKLGEKQNVLQHRGLAETKLKILERNVREFSTLHDLSYGRELSGNFVMKIRYIFFRKMISLALLICF